LSKQKERVSQGGSISLRLLVFLRREWKSPHLEYQTPLKPISGGFETSIFEAQLRGAPKPIPAGLVLRLFPGRVTGQALRESIVQNVVSATNYPAPRVFLTCPDKSVLGGEFNIMKKMPGKPMIESPSETVPEILGMSHAALHRIDPGPLGRVLEEQGIAQRRLSLEGLFDWIGRRISSQGYDWLRPGLTWLEENLPETGPKAICHGDYHPLNILMSEGKVTGILDWSGFRITDPVLDVGATKIVLSILAPVLVPEIMTTGFAERYLSAYEKESPTFSPIRLRYFEALRCIQGLLEGAEGQQAWRRPEVLTRILSTISSHTGLEIRRPQYH
jgi:aminoglycoside phosphotransferase (APT) family kinase protein